MAKMSQIKQQGQKWAHLRKEYLNCDWSSDTNIWMANVQGGDISARKRIFQFVNFGLVINLLKLPKLGIQLPNSGYDN